MKTFLHLLSVAFGLTFALLPRAEAAEQQLEFESIQLTKANPPANVQLMYYPSNLKKRPVILMLGGLKKDQPPHWSTELLKDGYMLAAFMVDHPPDPDPARRPKWLFFDERFAHGYALMGKRVPVDTERVVRYLEKRGDIDPAKIGWMGGSSTAIPGLAVATQTDRLAAVVAFVATGAYEEWLQSWFTNQLWRGKTDDLWPETKELFQYDPIRHADKMFPTAVLMVSGGKDKVVDPKTARSFINTARPYYAKDPERLRLVVYEGVGHNLPRDVVKLYTEHWFRLYMHPTNPPPAPPKRIRNLREGVKRTQINAGEHKELVK